jgi:raffinose/stachyose/melibiose transport system permease protein
MGEPLKNQPAKRAVGLIGRAASYFVMTTFSLMTILPLVWLMISSFKSTTEFRLNRVGFPHIWTAINYPGAWKLGEFDKLIRRLPSTPPD